MKYNILLFDADDTLLDFGKSEKTSIKYVFAQNGIPVNDETVALYSNINEALWKKLEKGEISRERLTVQRFAEFLKAVDIQGNAEQMNRQYLSRLKECAFLMQGAEELCATLSQEYRLFIITNGIAEVQKSRLNLSGIERYIEKSFISEELGFQKPQAEFFNAVFEYLGDFDKKDILVIGDSVTSDIAGGINAGLDTCLIDPNDKYPDFKECNYKIKRLSEIIEMLRQ